MFVKYPRMECGGFDAVSPAEYTRHGLRGALPAPVERCQQHGNVFTRGTDLPRNPYVINLSKCSASLHWGGDTLPSYGSTHLFFLEGVKTEMRLTPASRQGGCAALAFILETAEYTKGRKLFTRVIAHCKMAKVNPRAEMGNWDSKNSIDYGFFPLSLTRVIQGISRAKRALALNPGFAVYGLISTLLTLSGDSTCPSPFCNIAQFSMVKWATFQLFPALSDDAVLWGTSVLSLEAVLDVTDIMREWHTAMCN